MTEASLFAAALEKATPAERAAYLAQACAGNDKLRRRVEALLRAHAEPDELLDRPQPEGTVDEPRGADATPLAERPGTRIGPYKLLQQIGEGGMGVVYMAEQEQPVRRRVALKIVKPGMDSAQVIARFEAERQALALMDHPNIAHVFDAGTTGGEPGGVSPGRPYFVMELVHGVPITTYCDENKLSPRQRLELFVPVCQAIQHAHQKGIIHRDLKPSNVMVTLHDGQPVPKVIDFGVAKATEQRLTERTLFTQYGTIVGTFEYMAPEQAEMSGLGVDTRSDIYSLGVLLYELLTGSTPLERKRLREAAFTEMLRLIKEEEPPRPSVRLSSSGEALATISQQRGTEPAKLTRLVRGELDWIVMKCLEKDRTRRYETASGLARDLQRYLADEPVEACPPSAGYKLRKFARKHKRLLATAAALAVLLVGGVAASTWQAVRATRAETVANGERNAARAAEAEAKKAAAKAEAINNFLLNDMLAAMGTRQTLGRNTTVEHVLAAAAARVGKAFPEQPEVEAAVRNALGDCYHNIGLLEAARSQLDAALDIRRRVLGEEHPDKLASMHSLAGLLLAQDKRAEAEELVGKVLEARRRVLGEEHPDTIASMNRLGEILLYRKKDNEADSWVQKAVQTSRRVLGDKHETTLMALEQQTYVLNRQRKGDEAVKLSREILATRRSVFGDDHPHTLQAMDNLGWLLEFRGGRNEAISLYRQALGKQRRVVGDKHPATLLTMTDLARALGFGADALDEAEQLALEALRSGREVLGEQHSHTLWAKAVLARTWHQQGKLDEAERFLREVVDTRRKGRPEDSPRLDELLTSLGSVLSDKGELQEAEALFREAVAVYRKDPEYGTPRTLGHLATLLMETGALKEAESLYREVLALNQKARPEAPRGLAFALGNLGNCLLRQKRYAEAEALLRQSLTIREDPRFYDWQRGHVQSMLGEALAGQQKYAEAEPLLVQGYEGMKQHETKMPLRSTINRKHWLTRALERLVQLYDAWDKPDEAAKWGKELEARQEAATKP